MTIWVVVTDGERIRILEIVEANETPKEVNISNLMAVERSDPATNKVYVHSHPEYFQNETAPVNTDHVVAGFIQSIRSHLENAQRLGLFDHLVVAAPQEVLGSVIDNLTAEVRETLMLELETDLIDAEAAVIRASLPI